MTESAERDRRVVSAVLFSPRGGSAHVARAVARELAHHGWSVTLLSGSRTDSGPAPDAAAFYSGIDVRAVDFAPALRSPDPFAYSGEPGTAPMHPSFEERPGAPDRVFASLDGAELERQVAAWSRELERAGAAGADVLHLHHLTPLNEAGARVAPSVPVVGHIHGTELLMLERIAAGAPPSWRHAPAWAERLRAWAGRCGRLLVASPRGAERASGLLGVERERLVVVPNGFDPERFKPLTVDRVAHWRRHLVDSPQGWLPGREPGSVRYEDGDLAAFGDGPVLIYVGRFTEVKRIPLMIRAYARAQERFRRRSPLVLVGGHPGEWEGEHPAEAIESTGARDAFLAGWHGHDELPSFLNASDLVVLTSAREQFGQVLVEGMACGLPAVAVESFGAVGIVDDGETGWLVPPDDPDALAEALVEAVNDDAERERRGRNARTAALERYSWPAAAGRIAGVFEEAAAGD